MAHKQIFVDLPNQELRTLPSFAKVALISQLSRLIFSKWAWEYFTADSIALWKNAVESVEEFVYQGFLPSPGRNIGDQLCHLADWADQVALDIARFELEIDPHSKKDLAKWQSYNKLSFSGFVLLEIIETINKQQSIHKCCNDIFSRISREETDDDFKSEAHRLSNLLISSATKYLWTEASALPRDFFGLNSVFDLADKESNLIEVIPFISDELLVRIRENPKDLLKLHPRKFEEVIARIFEGFGFNVELTLTTCDQGRDIIAIDYREKKKYLIECKRYRNAKVGIDIVQRLHGVVQGEGATKGIIVTTSRFTKPALDFVNRENVKWRLEARDFDGIKEWLNDYHKFRISRVSKEPNI
jgi:restriction system protein